MLAVPFELEQGDHAALNLYATVPHGFTVDKTRLARGYALQASQAFAIACVDLEVHGVGTAQGMDVKARGEAELLDECTKMTAQIRLVNHVARIRGKQGSGPGEPKPGAPDAFPMLQHLRRPVEDGQHGPLLGSGTLHGLAMANAQHAPFAEEGRSDVAGKVREDQVAGLVVAQSPGVDRFEYHGVTPGCQGSLASRIQDPFGSRSARSKNSCSS